MQISPGQRPISANLISNSKSNAAIVRAASLSVIPTFFFVIPTEVEGSRDVCGAHGNTQGAVTNAASCTFIQAELSERGVQRPYEPASCFAASA
jgi:hypothetical protein